jgi:hypothetical protein
LTSSSSPRAYGRISDQLVLMIVRQVELEDNCTVLGTNQYEQDSVDLTQEARDTQNGYSDDGEDNNDIGIGQDQDSIHGTEDMQSGYSDSGGNSDDQDERSDADEYQHISDLGSTAGDSDSGQNNDFDESNGDGYNSDKSYETDIEDSDNATEEDFGGMDFPIILSDEQTAAARSLAHGARTGIMRGQLLAMYK